MQTPNRFYKKDRKRYHLWTSPRTLGVIHKKAGRVVVWGLLISGERTGWDFRGENSHAPTGMGTRFQRGHRLHQEASGSYTCQSNKLKKYIYSKTTVPEDIDKWPHLCCRSIFWQNLTFYSLLNHYYTLAFLRKKIGDGICHWWLNLPLKRLEFRTEEEKGVLRKQPHWVISS